jgi:hypothetical protein
MLLTRITLLLGLLFTALIAGGLTNASRGQRPAPPDPLLIRIEMTPVDLIGKPDEKPFRVGGNVRVNMIATNESDQRILVRMINPYYQNRPRLLKNDKPVPYLSEVAKIVRSKDSSPEFISVGASIFLEPYSSAKLKQLDLSKWYGPLEPGLYNLTNRYRIAIDGPWSRESVALSFQVIREP